MAKRTLVLTEPVSNKRARNSPQAGTDVARQTAKRGPMGARASFEDEASVRERARPYRLVTARMPLRALTTTWSLGTNRPVDRQQVRKLCSIFAQAGLNRRAEENYLLVLSSREDTTRMCRHLQGDEADNDDASADPTPLSFAEWPTVNEGRPAEVMAGQHRMKALEAYARQTRAGDEELWWTCVFYDRGRSSPPAADRRQAG